MATVHPVRVNLLEQPEFESSTIGKLLTWSITYGRYIMIGTEIIVLVAFVSRFSLDRKLTDLREEIGQKKIILQANQQFEDEFRRIQEVLGKFRGVLNDQQKPVAIFYTIATLLPPDVSIIFYQQDASNLDMNIAAGTTEGLTIFLARIQLVSQLKNIEVTDIKKDPLEGTQFHITAKIK